MKTSLNTVTYINKDTKKEIVYEVLKTEEENSVTFQVFRNSILSDTLMVEKEGDDCIITYGDGLGNKLKGDFFNDDEGLVHLEYNKRVAKWEKVYTKFIDGVLSSGKYIKK